MKIQPVKKIVYFLIFSHLFLATVVSAFYLGNKYLLFGEFKLDNYTLFVFFSTLALYNIHRIYGINKHSGTIPLRYEWASKHLKVLYFIILVSVLLSGYFANQFFKSESILLLICISVISLSYTFPLIPTANGLIRLKDIPLLKPVFISGVIICVVLILPQFNNIGSFAFLNEKYILICFAQFLFTLSLTFLFDIRDVEQDKENKIRTLPVSYGIKNTAFVSFACISTYVLLFGISFLKEGISPSTFYTLFSIGILISLVIFFSQKFKHPIWYMLIADGMLGLQLLMFYILKN